MSHKKNKKIYKITLLLFFKYYFKIITKVILFEKIKSSIIDIIFFY